MDHPNLFPGLTAEDRARLASIAGNLETLPELLNRLSGFTNDLTKVRATLPAIVDSYPQSRTERQPLEEGTAVPLLMDSQGRARMTLPRRRLPPIQVSIPPGAQVSAWVNLDESQYVHALNVMLSDDMGRLPAELISFQGSPKIDGIPDPALASTDARTITIAALGATIGVSVALNSASTSLYWWRLISAVPVGPEGRNFLITGLSQ